MSSMHGDMPQKERESIMKEFRGQVPGGLGAPSAPALGPPGQHLRGVTQAQGGR